MLKTKTLIIIINVENSCAASYFCGFFFFMILWWIGNSKEHYLFKVEVFYKILNVFTVTFDQFNVSLLNKIIISFKQQEQK